MKKMAKQFGVPENQLVFADLLSIGYSESDAYTIAYPENTILSATQNKTIRESILKTPKFKAVLEARTESNNGSVTVTSSEELLDKNQIAQLIMQAAMNQPANSKERIEGLMKYSDLMGYKKEDAGDAKDTIMFAFPIKCYQCPLLYSYNSFRKENGEKELKPVEMERVIRLADGIIKESIKKEAEK